MTTTIDSIDYMRAEHHIRTLVMDNGFEVHHDIHSIVTEFWETFGHFDWEVIAHDTDSYWAIIEKHRLGC